jgi:hypothetical protein
MELTQEYFDQKLSGLATKDDLKGFATKDDLKSFATKDDIIAAVAPLATKQDVSDSVDTLARIIATTIAEPMQKHFDELQSDLDVKTEVQELKRDMLKIKTALHLTT